MKAKVIEALNGTVRIVVQPGKAQDVPLETALNKALEGLKGVHSIAQSECVSQMRYTTVTILYEE